MNKTILRIIAALMLIPAITYGQSYSSLWKQAEEAGSKDLPQTQISILREIASKAENDKAYGQLLKANLKTVSVMASVAPDSLRPAVEAMERKEETAADAVLKAVYATVLYRVYTDNKKLDDDAAGRAAGYRTKAMAAPAALAAAKAADFEPFVIKGRNGKIFNDDMLSVVGYEVGDYNTLYDYYHKAGMRRASCMTALEMIRQHRTDNPEQLNKSVYINWLDSLTGVYSDLDVACEAAIERYNYMEQCKGVTVEDKISYIHYALDKWGGWQGAGLLRNAEKNLTAPYFGVDMKNRVAAPGKAQTVRLPQLRNVSSLTMKVYRAAVEGDTELDPYGNDYSKLKPLLTPLADKTQTRRYMNHPDYHMFDDSLSLPGLPAGVYMLEFQTSPATETARFLYYVTDMYLMAEDMPGKRMRYVAVNSTTGQPAARARLRLVTDDYHSRNPKTVTMKCDARGEAEYEYGSRRPDRVFVYTDTDKYCPNASVYGGFSYYGNERRTEHTSVFTDRSIYRPGQTVRVAAVVYETTAYVDNNAVAGKNVKAVMRDANYKVVAEKELTTDKYGTCSTDFTLPSGTLGGNFTVSVNNVSSRFRVEEYKRPTFQVEFPKINEKYRSGDTVIVKAKALSYAGVPVQGAKVKYKVTRRRALWWMPYYRYQPGADNGADNVVLRQGEAVTADDGTFAVEMPMSLPENAGSLHMFYNIVAQADVTDVGGETRSGELSVPLGTRATAFDCDMDSQVLADSLKTLTFTLRNAVGVSINADVRFRIDDGGTWMTAKTGVPFGLKDRLSSGRHCLYALCENDTLRREFVVFGLDDKVPCIDTCAWFYQSDVAFPRDGRPVTVQVGSSDKDVHIVYSVIAGNKVLESGAIDQSNALTNRKFVYKEEYGNGVLLTYAWVKNGRCHSYRATIRRPVPDRRLTLKWTTFRDKLVPGQQEEWRMNVAKPDGTPASAQLMATLYDKSLDQITPHAWTFVPGGWIPTPHTAWTYPTWGGISGYYLQTWTALAYKTFEPNRFDGSLFPRAGWNNMMFKNSITPKMAGSARQMMASRSTGMAKMSDETTVIVENALAADGAVGSNEAGNGGEEASTGSADQVRENLSETAFFYPALETADDGSITLKFTLPESLTTWRFMGMAHTADMYSGMIEGEAVAKKDVMIQPNMPRFVRMGDRAVITARIFNTSDTSTGGTAKMELIDPETEQTVHTRTAPFHVAPGATGTVSFDYSPGDGTPSLLVCRITASGKTFSDGEQHYLPVLPDRERVTVTVPFTQNEPGVKAVSLDKLFPKDGTLPKLTVEYTNNPVWLMVQALPSLGTPHEGSAIDLCAAFYANALGKALTDRSPKIKGVFDRWRMEQSSGRTSLTGSLAKNEELKDIVLSETPWVGDADRETEQKQRLADFFDESVIQNRMSVAAGKLRELQNPDGSWSWCPGMRGNLSITVETAEMLVRLNAMAGRQEATAAMLDKAFGYMGAKTVEQVAEMKKAERKGLRQAFPGQTALRYLYLCAIDGRKLPAEQKAASDYLIGLLKKEIKSQTIYDKAISAVVLARHGESRLAGEYVKSLKEYTVYKEETGRYYDTPRAAYSWRDYRIPTEVAAIEAIRTITPEDTRTADEMRRWLLQEKRTQAWDTPINSVNAIYAFINGNENLLATRAGATFAIDGKPVSLPEATAGMGYVKMSVSNPAGKNLTASKTSEGTSWGAVYAQFMQKTSAVEASSSGISVKREIVSAPAGLKVGDRVKVRITITTDRDLDFVQVLDRRAACMEPAEQLSGYRNGAYCSPKDNSVNYYFDLLPKGTRVIETEYYVDRPGRYETGTCTVSCAYAPEYRATAKSETLEVR